MKACWLMRKEIIAGAQKSLPAARQQAVEAHVVRCARCRTVYEQTRIMLETVALSSDLVLDDKFWTDFDRQLSAKLDGMASPSRQDETRPVTAGVFVWRWLIRYRARLSVAIVSAMVLAIGWKVLVPKEYLRPAKFSVARQTQEDSGADWFYERIDATDVEEEILDLEMISLWDEA